MPAEKPTPAILYAAKSSPDDMKSVPDQLAAAREAAERGGRQVVGEFSEADVSGYKQSRGPQLEAAMAAAKSAADQHGEAELWVFHSARLARGSGRKDEARALGEVFYDLQRHGVTLRSVQDDPYVTDEVFVGMASKMANKYSEDLSGYVKAGMKRAREAGRWIGGRPPYGTEARPTGEYKSNGKPIRELAPDKSQAPIVKRIFAEYVAGSPQKTISDRLREDNVPTAEGGDWHQGTVRVILANPVYLKLGVIDRATWRKAEAMREANAKSPGKGRGRRPSKSGHLFRKGMLKCGCCGGSMIPRTGPNRKAVPYEVYRCYGRWQEPDSCSMPTLRRADLDSAVLNYFERVGLDLEASRKQVAAAHAERLAEVRARCEAAEGESIRLQTEADRIEREFRGGDLTSKRFESLMDKIEAEREAANAEIDRLQASEAEIDRDADAGDAEGEALKMLTKIRRAVAGEVKDAKGTDAVRAALSRLFDHFVVELPEGGKAHIRAVMREDAIQLVEDGEGGADRKLRRDGLRVVDKTYAEPFAR